MKYVYEFIGTLFLVLTIGMTVIQQTDAFIMAPLAIGSILSVMIFAGGHISGAHYNPAVSFAIFLRSKLTFSDLIIYWIMQLAAAIVAGYLTLYFKGAPTQAPIDLQVLKALLVEFLFTFALCFVILNVTTAKETKGNSFYGFAIGFTVLAGAYAAGAISTGAFNPAVALGLCVMHLIDWSSLWVFIVANFLGGLCAALIFKAAHREKLTTI
jgi:aquaporin Z